MKKLSPVFLFISLSCILLIALPVTFFNILIGQGFEYQRQMFKPMVLFTIFSLTPSLFIALSLRFKKYICLVISALGVATGYVTGFIFCTLKGEPKTCVSMYAIFVIGGMLAGVMLQALYLLIRRKFGKKSD